MSWLPGGGRVWGPIADVTCCAPYCCLARYQRGPLGPLPTGGSILVVVDYFSRFLEVAVLQSTTSAKIIEAIYPIFARFRVPYSLRTDNGRQFVSEEFETFLQTQDVEHRNTIPLWPQGNREFERQNRSLLKCLQIGRVE